MISCLEWLGWCSYWVLADNDLTYSAFSGELSLANRSHLTLRCLRGYGTLPKESLQPELTNTRVKKCSALVHQDENNSEVHFMLHSSTWNQEPKSLKASSPALPNFFTSSPVSPDNFCWEDIVFNNMIRNTLYVYMCVRRWKLASLSRSVMAMLCRLDFKGSMLLQI